MPLLEIQAIRTGIGTPSSVASFWRLAACGSLPELIQRSRLLG